METGANTYSCVISSQAPTADSLFVVMSGNAPLAPSLRLSLIDLRVVRLRRGSETRGERAARGQGAVLTLHIADSNVSEVHADLVEIAGEWILIDKGSTNGTRRNGEPISRAVLGDGDVIEVGRTMLLFRRGLIASGAAAPDAMATPSTTGEALPLTLRPDFEHALRKLRTAAASPSPVLILGETGTGKEVVARAVHAWSGRVGPFIPINCGAIPANLIESELFGYARGAFSGAHADRPGLIQAAQRGTLLLDEIGDLPPAAQVAILRVLQDREVWPVGARRGVPVDVRIVCATHQDLGAMVAARRFRDDLYARLAGFSLVLPPLRERREDLGFLIAALGRRHRRAGADVAFTRAAMRALFQYPWPRNIRELERCIEVALALSRGQPIDARHLPQPVRDAAPEPVPIPETPEARFRAQLVRVLQLHRGNVSAVARDLGLSHTHVKRHCKAFGLDPASFRTH